tara:strand:- start:14 stop:400 length:387 start_codon:yes stop_codon:yes gene_type:complete
MPLAQIRENKMKKTAFKLKYTYYSFTITELLLKEIQKREKNPNYKIFVSESYLIKQLGAKSNEDIISIRSLASSMIDLHNNSVSHNSWNRPDLMIQSDINIKWLEHEFLEENTSGLNERERECLEKLL